MSMVAVDMLVNIAASRKGSLSRLSAVMRSAQIGGFVDVVVGAMALVNEPHHSRAHRGS